jgi:photosynthetic reaction center cytochrome c subunit
MSKLIPRGSLRVLLLAAGALLASGCEKPAKQLDQTGYRGTAMVNVQNPARTAKLQAENVVPVATPPAPAVGPPAGQVYQNVQVLGGLPVPQFARLMVAITAWVSPEQGCNYCHEGNNLASDALYTKVVARRMLQMTQHINADWQSHVAKTGVTCYTCHRGKPVPAQIWFDHQSDIRSMYAGATGGQNRASPSVGLSSLPMDPFGTYLKGNTEIRVTGPKALPSDHVASIQSTEGTFGLMIHMSESLGVNCTFCHNSRAFAQWNESRAQRTPAWHGIRMARDLNNEYLIPLQPTYPANRLGPAGDAPKLNCGTCHNGVNKPLYGVSMLADYAELAAPIPAPAAPAPPPEATPPVEVPAEAPASASTEASVVEAVPAG